jgi:hypothetical protein
MTSYSNNNDPNYDYDGDADDHDNDGVKKQHTKLCKITDNSIPRKTSSDQAAATQDARLKQFLQNADEIESIEHFTYWKDEFLKQFRKYLNPEGTATAREADEEIYFHLEKLAEICMKVKTLVKEGVITPERCSVKGQKSINEMISSLAKVEEKIEGYWPKTQEEEVKLGYTKFELAAVLVRDGFRVYGLMVATQDYVDSLDNGPLKDVLKSNQRSIIHYYFRCLDSFAQTMADLGMFKLMQKCVEIYKIRPRKKKKKQYRRNDGDALSDSSMSDDINKGRMFSKSKQKTKAVIDKGWTAGTTRTEVRKPKDKSGSEHESGHDKKKSRGGLSEDSSDDDSDSDNHSQTNKVIRDDEEEEEELVDYLYYFDPVNEVVAKVPRAACFAERIILSVDATTGKESSPEGVIEEWDGKDGSMGKTELIWKLKELLRGKANAKAEGLVSPPRSPKKKVNAVVG